MLGKHQVTLGLSRSGLRHNLLAQPTGHFHLKALCWYFEGRGHPLPSLGAAGSVPAGRSRLEGTKREGVPAAQRDTHGPPLLSGRSHAGGRAGWAPPPAEGASTAANPASRTTPPRLCRPDARSPGSPAAAKRPPPAPLGTATARLRGTGAGPHRARRAAGLQGHRAGAGTVAPPCARGPVGPGQAPAPAPAGRPRRYLPKSRRTSQTPSPSWRPPA